MLTLVLGAADEGHSRLGVSFWHVKGAREMGDGWHLCRRDCVFISNLIRVVFCRSDAECTTSWSGIRVAPLVAVMAFGSLCPVFVCPVCYPVSFGTVSVTHCFVIGG